MKALHTSFTTLLRHPVTPPASPRLPSTDLILQVLEEPLANALRKAVQPEVERIYEEVKGEIQKKQEEVFGAVWPAVHRLADFANKVNGKLMELNRGAG